MEPLPTAASNNRPSSTSLAPASPSPQGEMDGDVDDGDDPDTPNNTPNNAQYLRQFSDDLKLQGVTYVEDTVGNVCLHYPGSGKGERVVLQGHIDMVTERRADSSHDFDTDPLTLRYDGARWLTADGTTLGADNGVGVCAALAVVERACAGEISVPPLEVLCTVAEEVEAQHKLARYGL